MDPTCGLVDKFRDLVFDQIWEQLLYLIHYRRNIEQFHKQLEELTLRRCSIQHRIVEATNNVEQIEDEVLHWLLQVDGISTEVQQLQEKSRPKTECSLTSCPNPWLRYKLSKRAKEIAQEVIEICGKGNFDRVSYRVPPLSMPELTNRESNEGIDSRVLIINQIMDALRNPSVNMIGLCGLGGVGKTTVAKEVAKNQKTFEKVIMAIVSTELNIKKIQGQIAEKLGMQLNENTEDVRASRLFERLKQEKNMLLILDDLWEELDLGKVGIPFADFGNYSKKNEGCKILLTSRNKSLLSNLMKCQKIIEVGVLLGSEAWELFKRIAELSVDSSSPNLISIASHIVQKCGGLPLAIVTAGKALRNKDLNEWKDALARLNHPLRRNITGIKEMDPILKLSYDHLSLENKHIFLLAAMLSHDPSIEDLLMYSVGLDILQGIENMEEAHVGIFAVVSRLKSLNLLLDSFSSHRFTMHDIFRDVAVSIASHELHAFIHRRLNEWPDQNKLEGYKGICLQESDISDLPEELHGPRLEFFLLDSTKRVLTIPSMFFESSKELKLLALTNVQFSLLPSLYFLQKLKALCLHSCLLEDITDLRSLKKLKVLSLAHSEIERLPIELAELTSLQLLNLSHCYKLIVIPPKLLSRLKKLEILYMANSFDQWNVDGCSGANENASLDELKDLPISSLDIHIPDVSILPENLFLDMNLKTYKILIGKRWGWQGDYDASKILKLELENSIHLKHGVRKLLGGVEDLCLYGYNNGLENVLYSQDERGFPHLRHLQIASNDKFILLNPAHHEAAPNNIPNKIFESLFSKKVLLPKLETLELSHLNHLIPSIWDGQLSHNSFSNLKTLTVIRCGFVKLVPLHVLKSLNNLEVLDVSNCDMLEIVFDFEDLNYYNKEMESSSVVVPLKKLGLCGLPKLENVWSNHCQGNVSFQSLRSISVEHCKRLTCMFPASIAKGMLHELEELGIGNCDIDVIVETDQVSESVADVFEFPKLTSLSLACLPNLRNFYPERHSIEWPQLQQLLISNCDELEIFEKEFSSSSDIHEEESTLDSKYPLLSRSVICNLKEVTLGAKEAEMIGRRHYYFPKVKVFSLNSDEATTISYGSLLKSFPNLEELRLRGDFKEASGGDDAVALIAPFSKLTLQNISNMISLESPVVSSPNLTHLQVSYSFGLTTLMTSTTAQNLTHLTHLSIHFCDEIEEILTKREGEDDKDKKILFCQLKFLELYRLPRLKRFCGHNYAFFFPLLEQVTIIECPQLTMFCPGTIHAPRLHNVRGGHKNIWMNDLNNTIQHLNTTHEVISTAQSMALNAKNIIMIRDVFPKVIELYVESFQDGGATFPYSTLKRFPNLEILFVEHSSFEEIFPSQDEIVDMGKIPPFPILHIAYLDQLKSIWKADSKLSPIHQDLLAYLEVKGCCNLVKLAPSSASFQNLTLLSVSRCDQLTHLVTSSTAKSLVSLTWLTINDCKMTEEIVMNETNEDVEGGITFNQLCSIKLTDMPNLKMFSSQSRTFQFPKLEEIEITGCPEMKSFCPGVLETPKLSKVKIEGHDMEWKDKGDLNKTIKMRSPAKESVNK